MTSLGFKLPAKYAERRPDTDKSCGMGSQLLPTVDEPKRDLRLVKLLNIWLLQRRFKLSDDQKLGQ